MSYGLFLSAAGMQANEYRMNIVANNLANAETTGFKHDLAVFAQRPIESRSRASGLGFVHPVFDDMSGGVNVRPTHHSFTQGNLENTGRPFDVAIDGEGFFAVQDGDQVRYTRDGRMTFNSAGELVLAVDGGRLRVLGEGGVPIVRLADSGEAVQITAGGVVRQGAEIVGRIGLTAFDDLQRLRKAGRNLFEADDALHRRVAGATGQIVPQTLEQSTMDPIAGLATMIEVQRAYEINARSLSVHDQVTGLAVNTVGRVA